MKLEPLLGSTALYRADVSWNASSELSGYAIHLLGIHEIRSQPDMWIGGTDGA